MLEKKKKKKNLGKSKTFPHYPTPRFSKGTSGKGFREGGKEPLKEQHMPASATPHDVSQYCGVLPAPAEVGISCGHRGGKQQRPALTP